MTPKDVIKNTIGMSQELLTTYLSDLSDADLMIRPVPAANHIAWQLGHLIASEHEMMSNVGCKMPALPDGFAERYTKEASTSDDPAKFGKKAEYLGLLEKQRAATLAALDALPAADLDKATPEAMKAYAPTVGAAFNIIGLHVMMHVPQFIVVRRKLGKPVMI